MMIKPLLQIFGLTAPEPDPDLIEANEYYQRITAELVRRGFFTERKFKDGTVTRDYIQFRRPIRVLPDRVELEVEHLPQGNVDYKDLKEEKILENLSTVCRRMVEARHSRGEPFIFIIKRGGGTHTTYFHYRDIQRPSKYRDKPLTVCLGRDENGYLIWGDITKFPHILIGGSTGGGKSFETHGLLLQIAGNASPDDVSFVLVDLKDGVDFYRYNSLPHMIYPTAITHEQAYERFQWLEDTIAERAAEFLQYGANNIDTYLKRSGKRIPRIIFLVEEFANIRMFREPSKKEWAWNLFRNGAQQARAFGIHMVAITQRPSVQVIDGDTRMNFPCRLAFGVPKSEDSRVILGNDLAMKLPVGDMIYQWGAEQMALRGIYFEKLNGDEMKLVDDLIKETTRKYKTEQEQADEKAELERRKQKNLIDRMLAYAVDECNGCFRIEEIHARFSDEIGKNAVNQLAKELEEQNILSPSSGRIPRMVVQK